jgi:hypothetical protein
VQQKYEDLGNFKMVGRFFKNNDRLGFVLLPVAAIGIWCFSLLSPAFQTLHFSNSFLLGLLAPYLSLKFWMGFNLVLSIGGAYVMNFMCSRQEITEKQNLLPSFLYLVVSGLLNLDSACHPLLIGSLPLIGAFYLLFGTYRSELSLAQVFDAAFLISLGGLLYTPLIVFFLIPFISLLILKPFKLREWLLILLGLAMPVMLCSVLLFLFNSPQELLTSPLSNAFTFFHVPVFGKGTFLIHTAVILLSLLGIYNSIFRSGNFKIKSQKVKMVLVWPLLFGFGSMFFIREEGFFKGMLMIVPLSIYIGDYLGTIRKGFLREFLTTLLLAAYICSFLQASGHL